MSPLPPPTETSHITTGGVDIDVERDNKYHGAKNQECCIHFKPRDRETEDGASGSLITRHGSVSLCPEVSASQCLTSLPTKESRVTAEALGTLGEGRPAWGLSGPGSEGAAACWLGCEQRERQRLALSLSPEGLGETGQGSLELAPLAGSLGKLVPRFDGFSVVLTKHMKGSGALAQPVLS